jgi:hypothetical protein
MSDQPNPFVNPNQRGFELPFGYKNLNDLPAKVGQGDLPAPAGVQAGGMSAIRSHIRYLYEAKSPGLVLVVTYSERGALFLLSYVQEGFKLTLLLHRGSIFLEEAIVELFGDDTLEAVAILRSCKRFISRFPIFGAMLHNVLLIC